MRRTRIFPARIIAYAAVLSLCSAAWLPGQTLLVHLEFEGDTLDSSPNGTDGTLVVGAQGGSSYVQGPIGQALNLDHEPATISSDKTEGAYVSLPVTLPDEGSIVFWYHLGDLYNYQSLWDNSGEANDWEMWIYNDGVVRGRLNSNVGQVSYQMEQPNSWYHIAYTWVKGDQAHLWVNGVERDVGSTARAITEAGFDGAILGDIFFLGGGNDGNNYANGAFDDFRLYEGALDEPAVQALYAAGTPPSVTDPGDPPELLLRWDFEENFDDSSGNGLGGELIEGALGSHEFEPGPVGQALKLNHDAETLTTDMTDGAYVRVGLTLPDAGSIAFWYRPASYYNHQNLWDNSGQADDWEMWIYADGILRGRVDGNVGQVSHQLGRALEWYHIVYTWRRGDQARVWVNGVEQDLSSIIRGMSDRQVDLAILGDTFYLGGGNDGNTYGTGAFDDFRIYQGVLDADAVQALYEAGEPPVTEPPQLQLHWPLDGDLTDVSGNGRDGTLVTGAQGSAAYEDAMINQGLNLDHAPDTLTTDKTEGAYVSVPFVMPEAGTIALWYYVAPYYNYQSVWDNSVQQDDWEMWIYSDGRIRGRIDASSGDITYDLDNLRGPESWYHIAYAWNREAGFAELYIDGALVGSGAIGGWIEPGENFYLAGGNDGNSYAIGTFDDVRIYDKALDGEAIQEIMYEGMPPAIHWKLDGDLLNSGTLGSDYDAVAASGANGTPIFTPTLYGQGLFLDNDPAASTDGAYLGVQYALPETGTIALWYYARDYYNYQSIFDNSVFENDWEMWIYNDGRVRARVAQSPASGVVTYDLDELDGPNSWYHIVYTWDRQGNTARLYLNGGFAAEGGITSWTDPGEYLYVGGGNDGNTYAIGVFDEVRIYERVLTETEIAALAAEETTCPEEGDTRVTAVDVSGPSDPRGNNPGTYTVEATATDDSGDEIIYTFSADNGVDPAQVVGPQLESAAQFDLAEGEWTIAVGVDDNLFCPDEADEATMAATVTVVPPCPGEGDTHVTAIDVSGPTGPLGNIPGTYTVAATANDESGDPINYTFTVDDGVSPQVEGPQVESSATFELAEGTYTVTVAVDDDACPDEAEDATLSTTVEVGPEGVGPFIRGDCDGDQQVTGSTTDAIVLLMYAFSGGDEPPCLAACDANGDGAPDISDAIYMLAFNFLGGPAPVAPYPDCAVGVLESDFVLGCVTPTACEP
jgi:hypothetical protein